MINPSEKDMAVTFSYSIECASTLKIILRGYTITKWTQANWMSMTTTGQAAPIWPNLTFLKAIWYGLPAGTDLSTAELQLISLRWKLKGQRRQISVDRRQRNFQIPQRCVPPRDICRYSTEWSSHHVSRNDWLRDTQTSPCQHACPSVDLGRGGADQH